MPLSPTLIKLFAVYFLSGLVFWWGIEKLFLQSIGVSAAEIGWLLAINMSIATVLDVPAGMLADRWSRKRVLFIGIALQLVTAVLLGISTGFASYLFGYMFAAFSFVCVSGTYHALVYDVAHEAGQSHLYSKIMGRAYALFLCGAGVANFASGFIASVNLRLPFFLTVISCVINLAIILTVKEPTFHHREQTGNPFKQLFSASKAIMNMLVLRSLITVYAAFAVSELFKQDFSQLYFLTFNDSALLLGFFWSAYAFAWAIGNALAHRLDKHLNLVVLFAFGSIIVLPFWRSPWALSLFVLQAAASAAAHILIESRVQAATPSGVRASVLSVLGTSERLIRLPASILLGWLITRYDVFAMLIVVAILTLLGLIYWLVVGAPRLAKSRLLSR